MSHVELIVMPGDAAADDAKKDPLKAPGGKGISLLMSVANASKSILGAGILSLSWAFFFSTMWPGVFLTGFMCLFAAYGFYLLGVCSEITGMQAYGEIWKECFGGRSTWVPNVFTLVTCFLSSTSYLIICGDYVPRALAGLGYASSVALLQRREAVIMLVTVVIGPLNYLEDLSFLGYTSLLGTAGSMYTCFVLLFETAELPHTGTWEPFELGPGLFLMIPTVAFAFNGHFNASNIYGQLERRSPRRWLLVTVLTYTFCLGVVSVCGISGYLLFGSDLSLSGRSNVLNAPIFAPRAEIMVAYIAIVFSVSFSIPLYTFTARETLELLWLHGRSAEGDGAAPGGSPTRRNVLTTLYLAVTLGVALVMTELGLITSIAGAVTSSMVMFVFPAMMYLKCASAASPSSARELGSADSVVRVWLPWVSIVLGCIICVAGVATSLLTAANVDIKGR